MLIELIKRKKEVEGAIKQVEAAFHQQTGRLAELNDLIAKLEKPTEPKAEDKPEEK
ncbi:MAG: hypothetical protein HY350_02280 [Candidatus Omnitrophica bacterium]|nr:hypothetical protein [Candidatus Omnitrophota bacterium]